jgi:hypothetical protein
VITMGKAPTTAPAASWPHLEAYSDRVKVCSPTAR